VNTLSDTQAVYAVTVTNGSGTKVIEVAGTQATVWTWAEVAASHGAFGPGAWHPVSLAPVGPAAAPFTAIN
jgi:hypothetical protein